MTSSEKSALYAIEKKKAKIDSKYAQLVRKETKYDKKIAKYDKIIKQEMQFLEEAKVAKGEAFVNEILELY